MGETAQLVDSVLLAEGMKREELTSIWERVDWMLKEGRTPFSTTRGEHRTDPAMPRKVREDWQEIRALEKQALQFHPSGPPVA